MPGTKTKPLGPLLLAVLLTSLVLAALLPASQILTLPAGQYPGTTTNDNAVAGNVGEYASQLANDSTATVTFSNGVADITWTTHGFTAGTIVYFTTTGTLPTNFSPSTPYFIIPTNLTTNTFQVSATFGGTAIVAGSAGTGTQTGVNANLLATGTTFNIVGLSLTAGDWDVTGAIDYSFAATTSYTNLSGGTSTTSATLGARDTFFDFEAPATIPTAAFDMTFVVPTVRYSLASTTTVYLVAQATFTAAALEVYGTIRARRMR